MIKYFKYIKLSPCMYYKTIHAIFQTFFLFRYSVTCAMDVTNYNKYNNLFYIIGCTIQFLKNSNRILNILFLNISKRSVTKNYE